MRRVIPGKDTGKCKYKAFKALVLGQLYSIKQLKQTADVHQNYNGDDIC